tara:strand:+ start:259 stop:1167 length:909 start_codon:yes stop_codon:yes gene_type:complete
MTENVFQATHGNLPNGVFSPAIYSKKVLQQFRRTSVATDVTNTDYYGEIANYGDTVHIIKEPTIQIQDYSRGQRLQTQNIIDEEDTLIIDTAKAWQFAVDDIETKQAHINWQALATSSAMYALKDEFDRTILSRINAGVTTDMTYGTDDGSSIDMGFATSEFSPLSIINRLGRLLDEQNVPSDQRWLVASPIFWEVLRSEQSALVNFDFVKSGDALRNGRITEGNAYGFSMYTTNNMPQAVTAGNHIVMAGHMSAVSTANTMQKTEIRRSEEFFGDKVRGMHLYGSKVLRTESLVKSYFRVD